MLSSSCFWLLVWAQLLCLIFALLVLVLQASFFSFSSCCDRMADFAGCITEGEEPTPPRHNHIQKLLFRLGSKNSANNGYLH